MSDSRKVLMILQRPNFHALGEVEETFGDFLVAFTSGFGMVSSVGLLYARLTRRLLEEPIFGCP